MRKLILKSLYGLGDTVLFTSAVRDLHRCYPNQFITDVRTPCGELWNYNPNLRHLNEDDTDVEVIECKMPLLAWANQVPYHIIHTFIDNLNEQLGLEIKCTEFKGEIFLSQKEKAARSPAASLAGEEIPFWIVVAGGKHDLTIKWWDAGRHQEVVDHFRGRIQFVQVGDRGNFHPKLRGAIDLRGKLTVRELARLVYYSQGVLCGVTGLMHLAVAVERKNGPGMPRPCVVIAGGREPAHFEAYPHHQFIHTIGALSCCATGGCWKMRTVPLGDGHAYDKPNQLCVDVANDLPRCMDMISAAEVIRRVEIYFERGVIPFLNRRQVEAGKRAVRATLQNSIDDDPLTLPNARYTAERFIQSIGSYPGKFSKRGIVICAMKNSGFTSAWICVQLLRQLGCSLPVQLWHFGKSELSVLLQRWLKPLNAACVDASQFEIPIHGRIKKVEQLKPYSLLGCPFREVLLLEADTVPAVNPEFLFAEKGYRKTGAVFWPAPGGDKIGSQVWRFCGMEPRDEPSVDTAQILVDKERTWKALVLCLWYNMHADFFHPHTRGEQETFHLAYRKLDVPFAMPSRRSQDGKKHYDFRSRLVFQHRGVDRWTIFGGERRVRGFRHESECREHLRELRDLWRKGIGASEAGQMLASSSTEREKRSGKKALVTAIKAPIRGNGHFRKKSIAVVTLHNDGMADVGKITGSILREYTSAHGYEFIHHNRPIDATRHPAWNKVIALRNALEKKNRLWAMWIDADAIVMNHQIPLEALIPPNVDMVFASDFNGLNSGIFMVRHCEWSRKFLDTVLFLGDINHDPDGMGAKWEQNTIKHVLKNFDGFAEHVALLPERQMNSSVSSFEFGDFILHLGAMSNRRRVRILEEARNWIVR